MRRSEGTKANNAYRRTSQKPPAELLQNFKSTFSGLGQNVSSTAEEHPAEAGATALDDAPSDLPRYALLYCAAHAMRAYFLSNVCSEQIANSS